MHSTGDHLNNAGIKVGHKATKYRMAFQLNVQKISNLGLLFQENLSLFLSLKKMCLRMESGTLS